ncbi:MAG: hypothetical protein H6970_14935 [Gammaproteobacteria bacterium]|nr:hypothetical protein [Gammaproteobacteria bacterium]MCP5458268.1 hypothetical protein [Gammaproteobacteria bacterium]
MNFDELRERACASLARLMPQVEGSSRLVDECLSNARLAFRDEFILQLSPEAWARIALIYTTTFLDSQADVSVGDIAAAVLRDSIHIGRMEMLAQQLAQRKLGEKAAHKASSPTLRVVKPQD